MIRITKLTDYGVLLLTWFASRPLETAVSARELASRTMLPVPMVSKLLRLLARGGVLESRRGVQGGYRLTRSAADISVAEVIEALEGPIALTECLSTSDPECGVERICPTRGNWDRINRAIHSALAGISLEEMAVPQDGWRDRMSTAIAQGKPADTRGAS